MLVTHRCTRSASRSLAQQVAHDLHQKVDARHDRLSHVRARDGRRIRHLVAQQAVDPAAAVGAHHARQVLAHVVAKTLFGRVPIPVEHRLRVQLLRAIAGRARAPPRTARPCRQSGSSRPRDSPAPRSVMSRTVTFAKPRSVNSRSAASISRCRVSAAVRWTRSSQRAPEELRRQRHRDHARRSSR